MTPPARRSGKRAAGGAARPAAPASARAERPRTGPAPAPEPVLVDLPINLGQFLKVAQFAASGGEAKILIAEGSVMVNGQVEQRRGHGLVPGDIVRVDGSPAKFVAFGRPPTPAGGAP